MFQVIDKLSIHILLGMEFIRSNNCVPFANDGIISLRSGRVLVPMQVGGGGLAPGKFEEPVFNQYLTSKGVASKIE